MPKLYEMITAGNWHKGSYTGPVPQSGCMGFHLDKKFCPNGLRYSEAEQEEADRLVAAARILFPERMPFEMSGVADFNDHPDTTVEDVIRVCKLADV